MRPPENERASAWAAPGSVEQTSSGQKTLTENNTASETMQGKQRVVEVA